MINHNKNIVQYKYLSTRHFTRLDSCKVFDSFVEVSLSENVIFNTHYRCAVLPVYFLFVVCTGTFFTVPVLFGTFRDQLLYGTFRAINVQSRNKILTGITLAAKWKILSVN